MLLLFEQVICTSVSVSLHGFFFFLVLLYSVSTYKKRNSSKNISHVWHIESDIELSNHSEHIINYNPKNVLLLLLNNYLNSIYLSQQVHVQNCISSSYSQACCVRTASVLASLQWPHSKVGISRSITPQSEQRACKRCHTHAGVQAARWSDCDKCLVVGGRTVFQGVLNSKTVWATGSLFTWKGAQRTKRSKIYRRHHAGPHTRPLRIVCVLVEMRRTNWPATWSEEQLACTDGVIWMCSVWYYWTQSSKWSLTAAPCGPGGPVIPAWPRAPWRTD